MEFSDLGFVEDDDDQMMTMKMVEEIDWEHLLDDVPDDNNGLDFFDAPASLEEEHQSTETANSWIGEIEQLLLKEDDFDFDFDFDVVVDDDPNQQQGLSFNDFPISDILLESPEEEEEEKVEQRQPSSEPEVVDATTSPDNKHSNSNSPSSSPSLSLDEGGNVNVNVDNSTYNDNDSPNFGSNGGEIEKIDDAADLEATDSKDDDTDDDPVSKKRKRQLRNRDAAMRSRERKKMYVKDLEMKSRYLESECRRLGRLLQCCYAENHMLRISMQSGSTFGASMTKPESAVLLPESLLLDSLAWFMALMCLLLLSRLPLLSQGAVALESVNRKDLESAAPREKGREAIKLWLPISFLRSKRCRASRTKMKSGLDFHVLFV